MNTDIKKLTADTVMVEVATANLTGLPLRYAVAMAEGFTEELRWGFSRAFGEIAMWTDNYGCYDPATLWEVGGPLILKYGVMISPPESQVHRYDGPNAGWGPSGVWSSTIFRKGEHRRQAHSHQTDPLVPAMRCIVGWALGATVQVPQELMP